VQGAAALVIAAVLVLRGLTGADQRVVNGFGTAGWFALVGCGVLAAARALLRGRRWGRGATVFANLTLLPIAWYLGVGSHRWGYGTAIGVVALAALALLFSPAAVRWAAGDEHDTAG
jgi:peptidoglycan/LPS O-acetylase OafA/YrhL